MTDSDALFWIVFALGLYRLYWYFRKSNSTFGSGFCVGSPFVICVNYAAWHFHWGIFAR